MNARVLNVTTLACFVLLLGCNHNREHGASTTAPAATARMIEPGDDQYEVPVPRDSVSKVMQAKLAHAQAVLEGLALSDFNQIEGNAKALKRISEGGDWLKQESAAYFEFSAEFRRVCDDLVSHAGARNLHAVAADYSRLTNSCVSCHSYLRMERQTKDMPGRISMVTGLLND